MKAKELIENLFEADPNDYLKSLGIVRQSSTPTQPPAPAPTYNYDKPDDEAKMAIKGDLLNDLPEEEEELDFESMDGQDLIDAWTDACIDGRRIRYNNIDELINAIGYEDLEEFFQDNEGAVDSLQDWIVEWLEKSKRFGDDGWWAKMVQAIRDARPEQD
jgi:hypothetical protein